MDVSSLGSLRLSAAFIPGLLGVFFFTLFFGGLFSFGLEEVLFGVLGIGNDSCVLFVQISVAGLAFGQVIKVAECERAPDLGREKVGTRSIL
jgi:hypothetical protein